MLPAMVDTGDSRGSAPSPAAGWPASIAKAATMLLVSYLVFVLAPNDLLGYLSKHVEPRVRDLVVAGWWAVAFVGACWLFVRLQRTQTR